MDSLGGPKGPRDYLVCPRHPLGPFGEQKKVAFLHSGWAQIQTTRLYHESEQGACCVDGFRVETVMEIEKESVNEDIISFAKTELVKSSVFFLIKCAKLLGIVASRHSQPLCPNPFYPQ